MPGGVYQFPNKPLAHESACYWTPKKISLDKTHQVLFHHQNSFISPYALAHSPNTGTRPTSKFVPGFQRFNWCDNIFHFPIWIACGLGLERARSHAPFHKTNFQQSHPAAALGPRGEIPGIADKKLIIAQRGSSECLNTKRRLTE